MEPTAWMRRRPRPLGRFLRVAVVCWLGLGWRGPTASAADPFARFNLPDAWETRFWSSPNAKALFALEPKGVADLVPVQAGLKFCRCPSCDAAEADETLTWSVEKPHELTCKKCAAVVPNDKIPAHEDKKPVPEDTVEVLPGVIHHYPYHEVEAEHQRYPNERLYLAAKCDDEARQFLAKTALYAAVRYHEQAPGRKDANLAKIACVILVRFAQVYPAYAAHYDQPGTSKFFQQADLPPPYRQGYRTAKWEWTASQNVPLNLVIAYALLRNDPALREAGALLKVADPAKAIERDLFRASAEFVRRQPEEFSEATLEADRGLLAVGRLLNDPDLVHEALGRLDRLAERGFYYDGFWRKGTLAAHRRVLAQLDGWIDRLVAGYADPPGFAAARGGRSLETLPGVEAVPMLALAHTAGAAVLTDPRTPDVQQAGWPAPSQRDGPRAPTLLGGIGIARLAVGNGDDALDIELRDLDAFAPAQIQRQALRLAVGGRTALGDLDETTGTPTGFDRASASRNTVVVDGLNQRESLAKAREPAPGGNFLFFGADADFQVVTLDDPRAYPQSTTRYRQTIVATSGTRTRYAVGVFEVDGGLQHDQLFHGSAGSDGRWSLSVPTAPGPATLLAPGLTFVPNAHPNDERWFIQSYGEFRPSGRGSIKHPAQARLEQSTGPTVKLHLLGDAPMTAVTATSPDPAARSLGDDTGRGSLILRRRSEYGATLKTTYVTVFEPVSNAIPPLKRAGRVESSGETVVVYVETAEGPEHVIVNLTPGTAVTAKLGDGRTLRTDGQAVRISNSGMVLAGGSFVECGGIGLKQNPAEGKILRSGRRNSPESHGWFETGTPLPDTESLAGRVLLIRHGDGTTRGWTLHRVENVPGGARLHVREEPGFQIDPATRTAQYYQFPRASFPGTHHFQVSRISRVGAP